MPSPNKRLLVFNLATDADHPLLGFTTLWIRELARHVEFIHVITMQAGRLDLPKNVRVHSVGKEYGYSEPRRALEFYRILLGILRRERIDGCFSHMMQIFSVLAGPVLRAKGIPLITWYAHPSLTPTLKLAHLFSHRMVASLPHAYPWRKDKLTVIGQGIDTALFSPNGIPASDDLILCVGRLSPVKNHAALLRAAALLKQPVRIVIVGKATGSEDERYAAGLRRLAQELGLAAGVVFENPVPPAQLPVWYRRCAVHVNLTPVGFGDKVAWEAMACGRPCLVANDDFRETLGRHANELLFRVNDAADLAAKLSAVLQKTADQRAEIGAYLRAQVDRLHSLPRLAERILELLDRKSVPCPGNMKQNISGDTHRSPKPIKVRQAARRIFEVCTRSPETILYRVAGRLPLLNYCKFRFHWNGHSFCARPVDGVALQEIFLEDEYGFAARILAQAGNSRPTIIDGGANIGLFSLAMLVTHENAAVYSLEPDARTFQILRGNASANPALRWQVFPLALWKASGPLKFGATASSTASRIYQLAPDGQVETVEAITLSRFIASQSIGRIDLLKLDIEGAEEAVLRESEAVLDRVENLVVEIHPPRADEALVMRLLHAHFPHVHRLPGRTSAKPLVLASRSQRELS
jgi:FkbM family methyltransferase